MAARSLELFAESSIDEWTLRQSKHGSPLDSYSKFERKYRVAVSEKCMAARCETRKHFWKAGSMLHRHDLKRQPQFLQGLGRCTSCTTEAGEDLWQSTLDRLCE
jgi:hypothetical protein